MLFRLVPLLLLSLFISYVAGMPADTHTAYDTFQAERDALKSFRERVLEPWPDHVVNQPGFVFRMPGSEATLFLTVDPPSKKSPGGVFIMIDRSNIVKLDVSADLIFDLNDIDDDDLKNYSAIMEEEQIDLSRRSGWTLMKEKYAVKLRTRIMPEYYHRFRGSNVYHDTVPNRGLKHRMSDSDDEKTDRDFKRRIKR